MASRSALGATWRMRYGSVAAAGAVATAPAAAASFGLVIRVGYGEAAAHQPVHIVHLGALDVLGAQWVDQNAHAFKFGNAVIVARLAVQGHAVSGPGATHATDKNAQRVVGLARLFEKFADLDCRRRRDVNQDPGVR